MRPRDAEAVRRALGVLPDARGVYKRLTARENIAYFGELHGLDAATIADAHRSAGRRRWTWTTSSTARPKASRRASAPRPRSRARWCTIPRNVILDEPTNGLDVMTTRGLRDFLQQLRAEGRCVIFSSHIMQEVAALCDRIVVIAHGRGGGRRHAPTNCARRPAKTIWRTPSCKAIGSEEGLHA